MHRQHPKSLQTPEIARLKEQIGRIEAGRRKELDPAPVSSGCQPLDRLLPGGGLQRGTLVEWLAQGEGTGATTLAMLAAREAARPGGSVVVLDGLGEFYPPAAVRLGIAPEQLLVVRTSDAADHAWALDQVLRCPAVAATVARPEELGRPLDGRTFRRLQLAAEQSGGLGLLLREAAVRAEPSWADVRLLVTPLSLARGDEGAATEPPVSPQPASPEGRGIRVELLRCRGGSGGQSVTVEWDDETRTVCLAAQLADPAVRGRAAGAYGCRHGQ